MNLTDIMPALAQPFAIADVGFKPKPKNSFVRNGKTVCLALPYADPRVYEDRLNQVCPGEWSTQAQMIVAGDKMVCVVTVTICGVPHTDVGEAKLSSENAATEARAQAFKRACSQVGLGRFLYSFPKQYLEWEGTEQKGKFTASKQEMQAIVREMYRAAGLLSSLPRLAVGTKAPAADSPATSEQLATISELATKKKRQVKRPTTYGAAQSLLAELQRAG